MAKKTETLQIRLTTAQKAALRLAARRSGLGMSAFVLGRLLPSSQARFAELVGRQLPGSETPGYALAELNDLLSETPAAGFREVANEPPPTELSTYLRNYVAAMVEQAAYQKGVDPPEWVDEVEPLEEPHFAAPLVSLRPHLLSAAPVPFRRRNIFVDSTVGDRV